MAEQGGRPLRARSLALLIGVILAGIGLFGAELGLRGLRPDPLFEAMRQAAARGQPFDPRTRREVIADLAAAGVPAVPRIVAAGLLDGPATGPLHARLVSPETGLEVLPLAGLSRRTTVLCNESGRFARFESDVHGFRNPPGLWEANSRPLLLLGDSFTIGECVDSDQNIAAGLRQRGHRPLNLGFSGNSPLFELATLVEYAPALRPHTTLWIYFENDLSHFDLGRSARSPLLLRYLEPGYSQSLRDRQDEIDSLLSQLLDSSIGQPDDAGPVTREAQRRLRPERNSERLARVLRLERTRLFLGRLLASAMHGGLPPGEPPTPETLDLFTRILTRAQAITSDWQGEVVFVFLPGVWNFDRQAGIPHWAGAATRAAVLERVRSLGLRSIDLQPTFAAHPDPLALYAYRGASVLGSPHLGPQGYQLVAQTLDRALEQDKRR